MWNKPFQYLWCEKDLNCSEVISELLLLINFYQKLMYLFTAGDNRRMLKIIWDEMCEENKPTNKQKMVKFNLSMAIFIP